MATGNTSWVLMSTALMMLMTPAALAQTAMFHDKNEVIKP
jgi:ammonia channel protein AmtB